MQNAQRLQGDTLPNLI